MCRTHTSLASANACLFSVPGFLGVHGTQLRSFMAVTYESRSTLRFYLTIGFLRAYSWLRAASGRYSSLCMPCCFSIGCPLLRGCIFLVELCGRRCFWKYCSSVPSVYCILRQPVGNCSTLLCLLDL